MFGAFALCKIGWKEFGKTKTLKPYLELRVQCVGLRNVGAGRRLSGQGGSGTGRLREGRAALEGNVSLKSKAGGGWALLIIFTVGVSHFGLIAAVLDLP